MRIASITISKVEIPMVSAFRTGFGVIKNRPTAIVKITTDEGIVGYGETASLPFPNYKSETTDVSILALKDYIVPQVIHKSFKDICAFNDLLIPVKQYNFAKTGIETAVWMAISQKQNVPLPILLGGTRKKIEVGESIGIKKSIKNTVEEVALRIQQGFKRIKLKIQPGWDIKVVEAVRNQFNTIPLMVDANSSYTLQHVKIFKELDNYNLLMIEQPLADDDIVFHSILQKQIKTPICLDESINSLEDAKRAIYLGSCKIINIKPGRVGGILESKRIHDYCMEKKIGVWCGGMLESGIGRSFNIALSSLQNFIYPADMSPNSFYFSDDLIEPGFSVDAEGFITIPEKSGLGYEINERKLKKYTTSITHIK